MCSLKTKGQNRHCGTVRQDLDSYAGLCCVENYEYSPINVMNTTRKALIQAEVVGILYPENAGSNAKQWDIARRKEESTPVEIHTKTTA
ncbi:hypothetical protein TNCV_234011 [Trichonephila clavipes]|nr:hypothetical protein TNCV_234011 [Trichonephila clavipes]